MSSAATAWARFRSGVSVARVPLRWALLAIVTLSVAAAVIFFVVTARPKLPNDARGTLVFVSDRNGIDSLFVRSLPGGRERRLTDLDEPVREPALSPDGKRVAFSVGGRLAIVNTAGGPVRIVTLGADWKDTAPAWQPDGQAIVVAARQSDSAPRDIHLVTLDPGGEAVRLPLTDTPHLDESQPVFSPDGRAVVFVREDSLYRLDRPEGRARRIAGGFRRVRSPRFLPDGRVLFLWVEAKEYGIDTIDLDGKGRETLATGTEYYRTVAPSPDGRYLAATFAFDLAFHPLEALKLQQRDELRLLDRQGTRLAELAGSWRYANHTADWGR